MSQFPFYYNGRKVIGMDPITKKQYWKVYGFIWAWIAVTLYLILLGFLCPLTIGSITLYCPYLTIATQWPVIMVSIFTFLWTYFIRKQVNRSNYQYNKG